MMEHLLLQPIAIGPMLAPNRVVMPAMHLNFTMGGEISDQFIDFYRARAEGGCGLIVIGGCAIDSVGGGPFLVGIYDDKFIPGLTRFVNAVKKGTSTKLAVQLYQAGRYAFSWYTQEQPIAPSPLSSKYNPETPREMTREDIARVQQSFVDAAVRAEKAGFDGVEILGSAGYLIAQFLSPAANQRTDEYGGSFENRARFGCETIAKVKDAVGGRIAVWLRVAGHDFVPGGHTNVEAAKAAALFEAAGADAINVTGGWHESRVPQLTMGVPEGAYTYLAAGIKRAVRIPVISSNRLGDAFLAAQVLANGDADMIAMGRPLIADPELVNKIARDDLDDIRPCVACNQGCFDRVFVGEPICCMLNPQAGFEAERVITPSKDPKTVVVIGAGPGGVEAARVAARRGHTVTLIEKDSTVGGALWFAGAPVGRHDFARYIDYLEAELEREGIEVLLETAADAAMIRELKPDEVIVATGAEPIIPAIARDAKHPNVVTAEDVLGQRATLHGDVVVVGGGSVGVETAVEIAHRDTISPEVAAFLLASGAETPERVKELLTKPRRAVHVCDLLPSIGKDIGKTTRWTILQEVQRFGIAVHTNTSVVEIAADGVRIRTENGEESLIPCGTVVMAVGYRSRDTLAKELTTAGIAVHVVGDAKAPRKVMDAVHEGFLTAMSI